MSAIWIFITGVFVGAWIGFFTAALLAMASRADRAAGRD